jgi:hypothetical protein
MGNNNQNKKTALNLDLPDSENDKMHMKQEETIIELPDVEDIPGQEHIKVPQFKEFADTTISSDGEEGEGLFNELEDEETNVTDMERSLLQRSAIQSPGNEDEKNIKAIALDRKDNDGAVLNEGNVLTDRFGEDLDLPEAEETDEEDYTGSTDKQ